jgi:hypothetical protein
MESDQMRKRVLGNAHILIDNNLGQDYAFDGCMAYLMECLGEGTAYDYWFFAGVSGDSYTQVYSRDLDTWVLDLSHACYDNELMGRVFGAVGYGHSLVDGDELKADPDGYRKQVVDSIDHGVPVIAKGFDFTMNGKTHRNMDIGCVIGYENDGETFLYLSQDSVIPSPHMAQDPLTPRPFTLDSSYGLVFAGGKKQAPPLADVYREAIMNVPRLDAMPERDGVAFGTKAFERWASDLEEGKLDALPTGTLDFWQHYGGYLAVLYTNMYGQHFTRRAIEACPDWTALSEIPPIVKEMSMVCAFPPVGGGFDMEPRRLKDRKYMEPICKVIRRCADYTKKVIETIQRRG